MLLVVLQAQSLYLYSVNKDKALIFIPEKHMRSYTTQGVLSLFLSPNTGHSLDTINLTILESNIVKFINDVFNMVNEFNHIITVNLTISFIK